MPLIEQYQAFYEATPVPVSANKQKLIDHCRHFALSKGAARLQWVIALDNIAAQKIYNSLDIKKSE